MLIWILWKPSQRFAIPMAQWCSGWTPSKFPTAGARSQAMSSRRSTFARQAFRQRHARSKKRVCQNSCGVPCLPRVPNLAEKPHRSRSLIVLPAHGPTGDGRAVTSRPKKTRAPTLMKCATCWQASAPHQTARSGSTQVCIGPMVSTGRRKATTTWTTKPAS